MAFMFFFLQSNRSPIIFRQPPLSTVENIFVLPLNATVWHCSILAVFIIFLIMIVQAMHPHIRGKLSIYDIGTFVWGAVCQQGTFHVIPTISARIVVLTTFLAFLALFTSYSANIVALLQSPSHSIKTLEDLIASPLKFCIQEGGYTRYYYLEANHTLLQRLYEKKVKPQGDKGWILDAYEGVERLQNEMFAFQVDTKTAYKAIAKTFTASEKCALSEVKSFDLPPFTFYIERNSPYKELYKQR